MSHIITLVWNYVLTLRVRCLSYSYSWLVYINFLHKSCSLKLQTPQAMLVESVFSTFLPKYISIKFISHPSLCYISTLNILHFNGILLNKIRVTSQLVTVFKVKLFCHFVNITHILRKYEQWHMYLVIKKLLITRMFYTSKCSGGKKKNHFPLS